MIKLKGNLTSAARKVDKKVANLLPKVAQKVATLKNRVKTDLKPVKNRFFKLTFLDPYIKLVPNHSKTGFKLVLNQFKPVFGSF